MVPLAQTGVVHQFYDVLILESGNINTTFHWKKSSVKPRNINNQAGSVRRLTHHFPLIFWCFFFFIFVEVFLHIFWVVCEHEKYHSRVRVVSMFRSASDKVYRATQRVKLTMDSKDFPVSKDFYGQPLATMQRRPRKNSQPGFTFAVKLRCRNEKAWAAFKINGILLTMLHSSLPQQQWFTGGTSGYFISTEKKYVHSQHSSIKEIKKETF